MSYLMYKGKKFSVVTTKAVYALIAELAKKESRTISQMSSLLLQDGLRLRGVEIPQDDEDDEAR
jgi:hypothetical protein